MKSWGKDGVGDVSEELPALLVVLVALAIFISGVAQAYSSYLEREKTLDRNEKIRSFLSTLSSDPALTEEGRIGIFDYAALVDVNSTKHVLDAYSAGKIGFHFSIRISDASRSFRLPNVTFQDEPALEGSETVALSSPCNIIDADGFVRPALIAVNAWGFGE
jgi:hypothetical protein